MNINATLFVQMINFLVAYIVLRVLFFKPAVKAVQAQVHHETNREHAIGVISHDIELYKKDHTAVWQEAKTFFANASPTQTEFQGNLFRNITPDISCSQIPQREQELFVRDVRKAIVDRLKRC